MVTTTETTQHVGHEMEIDVESLLITVKDLEEENARLKHQIQKIQETVTKATERKQQAEDKVGSLLTIIENLSNEVNRLRRLTEQNHGLQKEKIPDPIIVAPASEVQVNGSVAHPTDEVPTETPQKTDTTQSKPPKSTSKAVKPSSKGSTEKPPQKTDTQSRPPQSTTGQSTLKAAKPSSLRKESAPGPPSASTQRLSSSTKKKRLSAPSLPVSAGDKQSSSSSKAAAASSKAEVRTFPYASLKVTEFKDLPSGVDRTQLETYLTDPDFMDVFKMTRDKFYTQPKWKQSQLKKNAGLF